MLRRKVRAEKNGRTKNVNTKKGKKGAKRNSMDGSKRGGDRGERESKRVRASEAGKKVWAVNKDRKSQESGSRREGTARKSSKGKPE